jgi:hypothetical protein
MPKATRAEVDRRVDEVYDLLISRVTYQAIIGYGASKWGVKERQMNVYIRRARERIQGFIKESEEERLATAIASYNSLCARQIADKDYTGARQTLDSLNRLLGLSARDRKTAETGLGTKAYIGLNPEDI